MCLNYYGPNISQRILYSYPPLVADHWGRGTPLTHLAVWRLYFIPIFTTNYNVLVKQCTSRSSCTFQFAKFNVHQIYRGYGISELVSIMTCKSFLPEGKLADDPFYPPTLPQPFTLLCVVRTYLAISL